ncbi:CPBP family intramembrane metalloprotease [Anoxybacillus sp. UARK-01]|uniref:CPBP family intramembrane metalloprotease n=1 Tax=Anoxybacteroides rupiense TaxID=311460 RepID=A0ABD5IQZ1_9BACL|nr:MULTISPECIES: CPBP family intramembrane glutamic endopeptidase [Anoxybacillus]MED5050705.1 CPBP family intramembrane metalloprotease [Anoxybacillus rupiensis]OQM47237.1 CPBP family intramembrane metalloprotease [Anoxybacillus sp. UARK-01]
MKKVIAVFILGLVAGAVLGAQQIMSLTPEKESQIVAQLGSKQVIIIVAMLQTAAMAGIATMVGSWASPKVGLNKPFIYNRKSIAAAVVIGLVSASFIVIPEKLVFAEALGLEEKFEFSWLYFLGSVLYGGIIEEILLRFGLMTIIIWIASKMTKSANSNGIYIAGIVIAALLFAAGHLPATAQMLGLSPVSVIRTLLLNFLPGIGFGYLYWKHGLAYAMLGHISTHVISQWLLLPLLFN